VACLEAYCDHCHSFVVGGFNLLLYLNKSIGEQTTKICPCINCGNGYLNIEMDTSVLVNF
jgi:RNase P subunit RPR2